MAYGVAATERGARFWWNVAPAVVVAVAPAAVAAANGGYFSTSWGWGALAFAWLAALGLGARSHSFAHGRVPLVALILLAAWTFVSSDWSVTVPDSVFSGERVLVLALAVLAFFVLVQRSGLETAIVAVVLGVFVVCTYSLATRLAASQLGLESFAGYRLARPLGYWNGLGIYAVIALALAVGMLAHAERGVRVILAVSIPVLAVTAYFTYSRGAAIAFGVSLVVIFALDPERMQWLARSLLAAAPAAVAVVLAARSPALTTAGASVQRAVAEGHRLALLILVVCIVSAVEACAPRNVFAMPRHVGRVLTWLVSIAAVAAAALALVSVGGPTGLWHKFEASPLTSHPTLNGRLLSFSGSGRVPLWTIALHEYEAHPVLGGGAGSYETYYLRHRHDAGKVRNAHNLYLETLAELGPIGLALLLVALLWPLTALRRARRQPLVPALAGAYVAFLVHMVVDWDWQLTGVAITGLFCGAGLLVAASPEDERPLGTRARAALLGVTLAAVAASFVILVGNLSLGLASRDASHGNWAASAREAKRARHWMPWSSEPYRLLGEAQLGLGDPQAAAASFHKAIAKSSSDWNLWFDLARSTLGPAQRDALHHAAQLDPLGPEIAELRRELATETQITVVNG